MDSRQSFALARAMASDSDGNSVDYGAVGASSDQSNDHLKELTEEQRSLLARAGTSYDVDLSYIYTLQSNGALCFVALKVLPDVLAQQCSCSRVEIRGRAPATVNRRIKLRPILGSRLCKPSVL